MATALIYVQDNGLTASSIPLSKTDIAINGEYDLLIETVNGFW